MVKTENIIIITEGSFDVELLKKILPAEITREMKFISSMGYSSAISKAKSLALRLKNQIILVLDSDTNNQFETEEKREQIEYIFKSLGKEKNVKTFLFMPEIEVIFLESKKMRSKLKSMFPQFDIMDIMNLRKLRNRRQLIDNLTQDEIESLRADTSMRELIKLCTRKPNLH